MAPAEPWTTVADLSAGGADPAFLPTVLARRSRPADWLEDTLTRVKALERLQENWDSYGAAAVDPVAVIYAMEFLIELAWFDTIERPVVTATPDGHPALSWDDGHRSVDLEIGPRRIEYAYVPVEGDDEEDTTDCVAVIAELLTRL